VTNHIEGLRMLEQKVKVDLKRPMTRQWFLIILLICQTVFILPANTSEAARRAQSATTDPLPAA